MFLAEDLKKQKKNSHANVTKAKEQIAIIRKYKDLSTRVKSFHPPDLGKT